MESVLPKISIVTPSYNQGQFLEKTILSIINQDYKNIEFIIIDGGSTDNSVEIIKKYEKSIDYWISEPDNGQSDAINKGFARANGDIFYWINSDDYLLPNALSKIANYTWSNSIGAVVGIGHKVNVNDEIVYTPTYYEEITTQKLFQWTNQRNFMQPACFFTKNAWNKCGPLNSELNYCLDLDLWIKISKCFKIERIKQELAHAYIHQDAKTTADVEKMKMETYLMIASHGGIKESRKQLFNFFDEEQSRLIRINNLPKSKNIFQKVLKKFKL